MESPPRFEALETIEECDQVGLLLIGKSYVEAPVIERHHVAQTRGRAVVKIWRAGCEPAKNGPLDFSDVRP